MYEVFRGEVAKWLQLNHKKAPYLAQMTGYSYNAISRFMAGTRNSENIARAISKVTGIEL